jgi:hypothetical protein
MTSVEREYIRICPVCGAEHPATAAQCRCGALLTGVDLSLKQPKGDAKKRNPAFDETLPPSPRCPRPDCGALNPPYSKQCVYCGQVLDKQAAAVLEWPWGERLEITGNLVFGREGDIPEAMKLRLAREFDNVSRRHAEFFQADGQLWVMDLGSSNGTYVDGLRLAPHVRRALKTGNAVRFAAHLTATVRIG